MVSPILVDCFVRANQDNSAKEFVKSFTRGRVYTHSPLSVPLPTKTRKKEESESEKEGFLSSATWKIITGLERSSSLSFYHRLHRKLAISELRAGSFRRIPPQETTSMEDVILLRDL